MLSKMAMTPQMTPMVSIMHAMVTPLLTVREPLMVILTASYFVVIFYAFRQISRP